MILDEQAGEVSLHEYCDRPCKEFLSITSKFLCSVEHTIGSKPE